MSKPKKIKVSDLEQNISLPIDLFICSSSYETRCRTIPDALKAANINHAIVCINDDLRNVIEQNHSYLSARFEGKVTEAILSTERPYVSADNLRSTLEKLTQHAPANCLVDVSTFTHEGLLILLKVLQQSIDPASTVNFVYATVSEYAIGMVPNEKWLSKGIAEIRSVLGYPGLLMPQRKVHLMVLVGFETDRAARLIDAYEPAVISLGFGASDQSVNASHHELNVQFHSQLAQKYTNVLDFEFSCIDPDETMASIQNQIQRVPDHNVVIAPMNTKISTIGAALATLADDRIQLCYAHAKQYNYEGYSLPDNNCFLFDAPGLFVVDSQ